MAKYRYDEYVLPVSPGDTVIQIQNVDKRVTYLINPKHVTLSFVYFNLIKIKHKSTDRVIQLDFTSEVEATLALKIFNDACDLILSNTGGDVSIEIKNYIDAKLLQFFNSTTYTHRQLVASTNWVVPHGMNFKPGGMKVTDDSFISIEGLERYIDDNTIVVQFNQPVSGWVFIS